MTGTPKFVSDTQNWTGRAQPILDQHPDVDPYLPPQLFNVSRRSEPDLWSDLTPGPLTSDAKTLWADSLGAYSGPLHVCDGSASSGRGRRTGGDAEPAVLGNDHRRRMASNGPQRFEASSEAQHRKGGSLLDCADTARSEAAGVVAEQSGDAVDEF